MSFAAVMVHVEIDSKTDARIRLAAGLAERFASTLIGVSAGVLPPYPSENGYFITKEFFEQQRRDVLAALQRTEAGFRAAAGTAKLNLEWRSAIDLAENYVASEARAADLVVVGQARQPADIARSLDPGTAILKAGRPVLVTPPGIESLKAQRIVIGWKDRREARRAVRDALPLLQAATSVTIVEVGDDGLEDAARRRVDDVARYLARHRVSVRSAIAANAAPGSVADQLVESARMDDADLIVAGGYGHSRLGEWIFGGVTRDLLKSSPVCCLFSN